MPQISDLLLDSLIFVGAYAQGQTANPDDLSLAFRIINRKIDSLSAEKLSMMGMHRSSFSLLGLPSYTYGPGMQWNTAARPIKLKSASVIATNNTEQACRILTADQWAAVLDKSRSGVYADAIFYDNGYPTGNVYLTPMPVSGQMVLWTFEAIPQLPAQTGSITFAPGYEEAIVKIAAVDLSIAFQRPLTQELNNAQIQAKNAIVQLNAEIYDAPMPAPQGPAPTTPLAERAT